MSETNLNKTSRIVKCPYHFIIYHLSGSSAAPQAPTILVAIARQHLAIEISTKVANWQQTEIKQRGGHVENLPNEKGKGIFRFLYIDLNQSNVNLAAS